MQLTDLITSKFGKSFAVIAIVAMLGGCAGVTDAGLNQEADANTDIKTEQVDQNHEDQSDQDPYSSSDDPGVIYDEPDL